MEDITSAAEAFSTALVVQDAFKVLGLLNLVAYLNPYSGCIKNNSIFDYIIVGGGTSGCVLGNRLSEDSSARVLVIEAGGDTQLENTLPTLMLYTKRTRFDWNYTTLPDESFGQCHQSNQFMPTVAKVLGGESSVDFMLYSQGDDRDYNEWAKLTNEPTWRFENVLRLLKKIERFNDKELENSPDKIYHGFTGNLGLTKDRSAATNKYFEAFKQVGYPIVADINNKTKTGFTNAVFYIDDDTRQNSAYAYLYPVRNRTNLVVLKNTQVTKINFNKKKEVVGVEAIRLKDNRKFVIKVRKEIIVTAGAFNTAKLLQLSGIGPKKLLKKLEIPVVSDLPVGKNYRNHVAVPVVYAMQEICNPYAYQKHDPHNFPAPTFVGYISLNKSDPYPSYRTVSFEVTHTPAPILLQYASFTYRYKDDIADYWYNKSKGRELLYSLVQNTKPKSSGQVQINSRNPFDPPRIKTGYFSSDEDVKDMIEYLKDFMRVLKSPAFKKVGAFFVDPTNARCGEYDADSDEYWRCYVKCLMAPVSHHSGTATLKSVVDGRLRVYGVKGLRVADASIIPNSLVGSITIPTVMIGENAAEMIRNDWKGK